MTLTAGSLSGTELCEVLGVDPANVIDVTIRFTPGRPATATVTMLLSADLNKSIVTAVKRYALDEERP